MAPILFCRIITVIPSVDFFCSRDPISREHPLRFRIGIAHGRVFASPLGSVLPKFSVFGEAVYQTETLAEICPPGKVLVHNDMRRSLPSVFRLGLVGLGLGSRPGFKPENHLFVLEKVDHSPIPILQMLHAYASFKNILNNKRQRESKSQDEKELEEEALETQDMAKGKVLEDQKVAEKETQRAPGVPIKNNYVKDELEQILVKADRAAEKKRNSKCLPRSRLCAIL